MTLTGTLTLGGGRLRALLLVALSVAFGGCDGTDHLTNVSDETTPAIALPAAAPAALFASSSSRAGIPFGAMHVPNDKFGSTFTGALRSIWSTHLLEDLQAARQAGTRVIVSFVGADNNYQNSNKSFSLAKWKQRLEPYRGVDFSSYIADGTIIGHYILDEPHDPTNWGGTVVSPATVDEMARYSKQLWPTMPTIIRGWPAYLKGYNYRYLDAAWAQYSERKGDIAEFVRSNVRDAKTAGLTLVVGLNILDGGTKASGIRGSTTGKYAMSASQVLKWGGALLDDDYPCAFVSWKYDASYMSRSDIKSALAVLSQKAQQHAASSCAMRTQAPEPPVVPPPVAQPPVVQPPVVQPPVVQPPVVQPPVVQPPVVQPPVVVPPVTPPVSLPSANPSIVLKATGRAQGNLQLMTLTWTGATGSRVDVYRDGVLGKNTENDRYYVNALSGMKVRGYSYKVCEQGTSSCSNVATVTAK
jgi:hypothetical protein